MTLKNAEDTFENEQCYPKLDVNLNENLCAVLMVCIGNAADDDDVVKFGSAVPAPARNTTATPAPTIDMEQFRRLPDLSKQEQRTRSSAEAARCDGRQGRRLCLIYDGALYDVTDFAHLHPGGAEVLRALGGRDATAAMRAAPMPPMAFQLLERFRIGTISEPTEKPTRAPPAPDPDPAAAAPAQPDAIPECSYGNQLLNLCDEEAFEDESPEDPLSW